MLGLVASARSMISSAAVRPVEVRPARFLRHPEDVRGQVFVRVLSRGGVVGQQGGALRLEGQRDVLEEDQAEGDVLVVGGLEVLAQLVGGLEELRLEAEGGAVVGRSLRGGLWSGGRRGCWREQVRLRCRLRRGGCGLFGARSKCNGPATPAAGNNGAVLDQCGVHRPVSIVLPADRLPQAAIAGAPAEFGQGLNETLAQDFADHGFPISYWRKTPTIRTAAAYDYPWAEWIQSSGVFDPSRQRRFVMPTASP